MLQELKQQKKKKKTNKCSGNQQHTFSYFFFFFCQEERLVNLGTNSGFKKGNKNLLLRMKTEFSPLIFDLFSFLLSKMESNHIDQQNKTRDHVIFRADKDIPSFLYALFHLSKTLQRKHIIKHPCSNPSGIKQQQLSSSESEFCCDLTPRLSRKTLQIIKFRPGT